MKDLQIRFKLFNVSLSICNKLRTNKEMFNKLTNAVQFQYTAYVYIWQYFNSKFKFNSRKDGKLLEEDIAILRESLEVRLCYMAF